MEKVLESAEKASHSKRCTNSTHDVSLSTSAYAVHVTMRTVRF